LAKFHRSLVSGQLPGYGKVLITAAPWYGNPGNSQYGRVYILSASKNYLGGNFTDIDQTANQILEGTMENSRFGYSLALLDYNTDGLNDLAVSAPSQGEIGSFDFLLSGGGGASLPRRKLALRVSA
jgi:glycosylphosphatidylinositol phospholipase D